MAAVCFRDPQLSGEYDHSTKKQIVSEDQPNPSPGFVQPRLYALDAVANPEVDPGNPLPEWCESIGTIRMKNANVRQILEELCRLTGRRHVLFEGEIQILPPIAKDIERNASDK